jgi:ribonuclease HII
MSASIVEKSQSDDPVLQSVERHEAKDYNEATAELASLRGKTLIGVDEAGRGPLFGRVYAAAVLLHEGFDVSRVKDSKKFTSEKKRAEAAAYIKANSVWSVAYMDEGVIDKINVLQATMRAMHTAIHGVLDKEIDNVQLENVFDKRMVELMIDGNYFKPLFRLDGDKLEQVPHMCIEKGDAIHPCISAASILAKVARDDYVVEMCVENPELDRYGLRKNKGYGTKAHMDAIQQFGLSPWHRKSFNKGSALSLAKD